VNRAWKLTLEYDGTRYSGWQEQKNARTVAGEIRRAAEEFLQTEVDLHGSGRTDAGVHALAQVAHLRANLRSAPGPEELRRALNSDLPADIAVLRADPAPLKFHARHDALRRSYIYQISTRKRAFEKRYVWWVKERLDIETMQAAAAMVRGRHDFNCFRAPDPSKPHESTIVVVDSASVRLDSDLVLFRIEASHFLWRMVRRIVGVLVRLGHGEISLADFESLLAAKCNPRLDVAAWTAPAAGLFLEHVSYK
jgi:tRNA pseudouridine38-40 synthase